MNVSILTIILNVILLVFGYANAAEEAKLLFDSNGAYDYLQIFSTENSAAEKSDNVLLFSSQHKRIMLYDLSVNATLSEFSISDIAENTLIKGIALDEENRFVYLLGLNPEDMTFVEVYRIELSNKKTKKVVVNVPGGEYHDGVSMNFFSHNVIRINDPVVGVAFDISIANFDCDGKCESSAASTISLPITTGSIQSLPSENIFLLAGNQEAAIYGFDFERQGFELLTSLGLVGETQPLFLDIEKGDSYPLLAVGNPASSEIIIYKYNKDYKVLDFISKMRLYRDDEHKADSEYMVAGSDNLSRLLVYDRGAEKLYIFSFIEGVVNLLASESKQILGMDVTGDGRSYLAILNSGEVYKYPLYDMEDGLSQERKIFRDKYNAANISFFSAEEFINPIAFNDGCVVEDYFPPRRSWCNAIETAKVMSEFRRRLSAKFGRGAKVFIKAINNSCLAGRGLPYKDFLSLEFSADKGSPADWVKLLMVMQNEKVFSGGSKEQKGMAHLTIDVSEDLWVYVGEEGDKGDFESKYFNLDLGAVYVKGKGLGLEKRKISPLTKMTLRMGPPIKSGGKWVFAEKASFLAKHHSLLVHDSVRIDSGDSGLHRYWVGGRVLNEYNESASAWLVVVKSSSKLDEVKGAFETLQKEYPDFPLEVYKDPKGVYAIVIGEKLSQLDAKALVMEAKCAGISEEAYMWVPVNWKKLDKRSLKLVGAGG